MGDGGTRIAGAVLDITEARRAADEARIAQERMTHVARLATMGEMTAGIAHELNQPLAAITNYASAASRLAALQARIGADPDGDLGSALTQIGEQALRAGEIIRRLRALVQNRETQRETVRVNELVEEVLGFARSDARLSEVQIVTEFDIGIPKFSLDRVQIQQVLLNLLRNAIESLASNPRDQRIVHVRTSHDDERILRIEVADNGPGVPEELVARIFDPFCTTKETGTGLGLAISRTIVAAHHGKLSHRVIPTGGASFTVELPSPNGGGE
jgi:C4-dicarboxylate-specific signal transduction histidine kinase